MGPISILNDLSEGVARHIGLARNGDEAAKARSWEKLSVSVIPPALELESMARSKFGLRGSAECGTADDLLVGLRDGTSPYSLARGGLGSYLWASLRGDSLDEIRRRKNRRRILQQRLPRPKETPPIAEYELELGRCRQAILGLGGRLAKVGALLHLDYWNMSWLFSAEELRKIGEVHGGMDGSSDLSKTQIAWILSVANATVTRDAKEMAKLLGISKDDHGDANTLAM
jgi:hypothetical protein